MAKSGKGKKSKSKIEVPLSTSSLTYYYHPHMFLSHVSDSTSVILFVWAISSPPPSSQQQVSWEFYNSYLRHVSLLKIRERSSQRSGSLSSVFSSGEVSVNSLKLILWQTKNWHEWMKLTAVGSKLRFQKVDNIDKSWQKLTYALTKKVDKGWQHRSKLIKVDTMCAKEGEQRERER